MLLIDAQFKNMALQLIFRPKLCAKTRLQLKQLSFQKSFLRLYPSPHYQGKEGEVRG
jgi:hypothetical protein